MAIRTFRPYTPGTRTRVVTDFSEVTSRRPERSLVVSKHRRKGRNNRGVITCRHRGGGHKRLYRLVDFRRNKHGVTAKVAAIHYDPHRNARLALLFYADGEKRYILSPLGLEVGTMIQSGPDAEPTVGNAMKLKDIPIGLQIHNIELKIGRGGQICRTAGGAAQLMAREGQYAVVLMPSGELRRIHIECMATIGRVGNTDHQNVKLGKAGRNRHRGRRPKVRGTAMNPVDHPMGGGEGRTAGGRHPCSPTGVLAKGGRTRSRSNPTDKFIIRRRKKRK